MSIVRRAAALLTAAVIAFAPGVASAAFEDRVMNKEGFWGVDVDGDSCAASMAVGDGSIFMLKGTEGQVTFAVFFAKPVRAGKKGEVRTEAYGFEFKPSFTDDKGAVFFNGDLDSRAIAALRLAKEVRVLIDGRLVNAATFENTGFEGALDALIACSKGEAGWWGAGVGGEPPAKTPAAEPQLRYNKEDVWAIYIAEEPHVCVAQAEIDNGFALQLLAGHDVLMLGIGSAEPMPKDHEVRVETDTYSFTFSPKYSEEDHYLISRDVLDSQAVFALRRAKGVRVSIGRKMLFETDLESGGYPAILEDVLACSHGEKGWWNEPAPAS